MIFIRSPPIKLLLDAEQVGTSSDLIVPTPMYRKHYFYLLTSLHPHLDMPWIS